MEGEYSIWRLQLDDFGDEEFRILKSNVSKKDAIEFIFDCIFSTPFKYWLLVKLPGEFTLKVVAKFNSMMG